jgi:3-oxoacyl-[acyl-carrier-protein] synthase-1
MKLALATALCVLAVNSANAFAPSAQVGSSFVGSVQVQSRDVASTKTHVTRGQTTLSMVADRRIVVTGMGITSCLGNSLEDVTASLREAKCGIQFSEHYAEKGMKSHVCARPNLTDEDFIEQIPKASLRFMGTNARFAYIAMKNAIEHSGLKPEEYEENPRVCSILGQGGTSIPDITETVDAVNSGNKRWKNKVGPFRVTRSMGSTVSAVLSTAFKLQGASYSISSACSTGAHCIGTGFEQILLGKSDMAMCGAGEAEDWGFTAMFDCMGALSTSYNDTPKKASRAFDKDRDGFVIAGGGGIVILEELEHAKARGAKIYAELVGYGANADG